MRVAAATMLVAAMVTASPCDAAKTQKPPKGHLGSEWVGKDGNMRHPQLGLELPSAWEPELGLYRQPAFNWRASNLQTGPYPAAPLKADKEAEIALVLNIDKDGVLTGCTVESVDIKPAFASHACPHLVKHARFHPALNDQGERIAASIKATLSYQLQLRYYTVAAPDLMIAKRAQLIEDLDLAAFGITANTKRPANVEAFSAAVRVDPKGKAVACNMTNPTYDDSIDARVCDKLMNDVTYTPAQDHKGQAVVDIVTPFWRWELEPRL
jgi:hypothetical protein